MRKVSPETEFRKFRISCIIFILSCWAFTTAAALEYQFKKTYGRTVNLSEQYVVDCASTAGELI